MIDVATGMVTSPEPYQGATMTLHLLKTQNLATLYQAQFLVSTLVSDCIVFPDIPDGAVGLEPYPLVNCALVGIRELTFSGRDVGYAVTVRGTYYINSSLWV